MCGAESEAGRRAWLIARDADGNEIDRIQVTGPDSGTNGMQSGVEMGDGELKEMWHARRSREEVSLVGVPGATPGADQVEVRRWTMRLITKATDDTPWEDVERRLWRLTTPDRIGRHTGFFVIHYRERNGRGREITVKRTGTPKPESSTYAGQRGYEAWTFEVTAYDPWWYGEDEVDRVELTGSGDHTLQVRNPGDQLGFLRYIIPASDADVYWTVPDGEGTYPEGHPKAGQRIRHRLPLVQAGQIAEASQRPDKLPFRILGIPMSFGLMRQTRFTNPIEPGGELVDLPVTLETNAPNAGQAIEVRLTPAYDRPHS